MGFPVSTTKTLTLRSTETTAEHAAIYAVRGGAYRAVGKRLLDLTMIILILPIVLPVIAMVTLALLVAGHSPFYSQKRLGRGGRVFRIWKFQTMHPEADKMLAALLEADPARRAEWQSTQKLKQDPRITRIGSYLRKTSIDELPQLWNVLKGDMSLLGPRPMMPDQKHLYGPAFPVYASLRPGISGMWQVSERNESHFQRRAELDIQYARDLSLATDLRLVWQTLRTVLYSTGY